MIKKYLFRFYSLLDFNRKLLLKFVQKLPFNRSCIVLVLKIVRMSCVNWSPVCSRVNELLKLGMHCQAELEKYHK